MSKRFRSLIFYSSVILFLIGSYAIVFFALGYQYDFVEGKFVRMGSLRIGVNTGAEVYINDKLEGKTSLFGDSLSKARLLPRTYDVRLEKEGHQPWTKNVQVMAGLFTDVPHVILMTETFNELLVASPSLELLAKIASGSEVVQISNDKTLEFDSREIWITWHSDTNYQPYRKAGDRELIVRKPKSISEVQWFKSGNHLLYSSNGILYFTEIDKRGGLNEYHIASIDELFWYDSDKNTVFFSMEDGIYEIRF